ncbi:MAG TPA: protein kinase [Anaeromyxobacteraceae bacterium]|nr:protein kinase [Anaeromyxobacteraceae bacterium]
MLTGEQVGRYEIRSEIGRGGFGAVYEAFDPELGRAVALKALRPGRSIAELGQAWIRKEAEAIARLDHPGIVTVHDVGTCPVGAYLVMELLRGETLARRLDKGPMPTDEALRIAEDLARGLAHAHERGVLHRDLKPGNVFLTDDGRVKLLDFGLAHLLGTPESGGGGTPAYMAPEQARGDAVDERADIYAAGAILGEMLTGRTPADTRSGVPKVGRALARLVATATAPEPPHRPRDGTEWLAALVEVRRRRERPRAARRVALLAGVGVALGVMAAGIATWRIWRRQLPPGRVTVAVAEFTNETGDGELDGLGRLLAASLQESPLVRVVARERLMGALREAGRADPDRIDEGAAREVGARLGVDALLLASIRRFGESYAVEVRAVEPGRDPYLFAASEQARGKEKVLEVVDRLAARARRGLIRGTAEAGAARPVSEIATSNLEAWRHYVVGLGMAERYVPAASAEFRRAIELAPDFALAHYQLLVQIGREYGLDDDLGVAATAAMRVADRAPWREGMLIRAVKESQAGRVAAARAIYREVLERDPDDKEALVQLGLSSDPSEAMPLCEKALALDPVDGMARACIVFQLAFAGKTEALLKYARAWAERPTEGPEYLPPFAFALAGSLDEAVAAGRRAADLGPPGQIALVLVLEMVGDYREMEAVARRRIAATNKGFASLGRALAYQGRRREAIRLLDRAWAERAGQGYAPPLAAFLIAAGDGPSEALRRRADALVAVSAQLRAQVVAALAVAGDGEGAATRAGPLPADSSARTLAEARLALARGEPAVARALLAPLTGKVTPGDRPAELLLGEACAAQGDVACGVAALERYAMPTLGAVTPLGGATTRTWGLPRARLLLARVRDRLGELHEARRIVDQLLAEWKRADPDYPLLAEARALRAGLVRGSVSR